MEAKELVIETVCEKKNLATYGNEDILGLLHREFMLNCKINNLRKHYFLYKIEFEPIGIFHKKIKGFFREM